MSTKKVTPKKVHNGKAINLAFNTKAFAADILATRERLDLTQSAAAKIAGVSQVTVFEAELKGSCSLRSLPGICNLIGKPVQHYFAK